MGFNLNLRLQPTPPLLHQPRPHVLLARRERAHFLRTSRTQFQREAVEPGGHVVLLEDFGDLCFEARGYGSGGGFGHDHRKPDGGLVTRHSRLHHRRHARQQREALATGDAERGELADLDVRGGREPQQRAITLSALSSEENISKSGSYQGSVAFDSRL